MGVHHGPIKYIRRIRLVNEELSRMKRDNRLEIEQTNRESLKKISFIIALLLVMLVIVSLIGPGDYMMLVYASFAAISIAVYCFCRFFLPWLNEGFSVRPVLYGYILCMFLMSFFIAFFVTPRGTMVTFIALMIAMPLIIVDEPRNLTLIFILVDAAFIICALTTLPIEQANDYVLNCVVFSLTGLFMGRHICQIKLKALDSQRQLLIQSHSDVVTGLGNRRKLFELLARLEDKDDPDTLSGVMMIDIDNFKQLNDYYGHQKGDDCLNQFGTLMMRMGAESGIEFFRYGGEEFIALSVSGSCVSLSNAAQKLLDEVWKLNIPFEIASSGRVTASIGYAYADNTEGYEQCIRRADQALYVAKDNGRNDAVGYTEDLSNEFEIKPSIRSRV